MPPRRTGMNTKGSILNAALIVARGGLSTVTLRGVARAVGVSHKVVVHYFGNLEQLHSAVAAEGLARGDNQVIARLILDKHPAVENMPGVERDRYLLGAAG